MGPMAVSAVKRPLRTESFLRMQFATIAGACAAVVTLAAFATALASASYASSSGIENELFTPLTPTTPGPGAKEIAVLTRQGIPHARAVRALEVQDRLTRANLANEVERAMGSAFAGLWFDNAAAQLHIGVASPGSRQVVERIVAGTGLTSDVTITPVRSTWAELTAAQSELSKTLTTPLAKGEATTGLDSQHNAVAITLSSAVSPAIRASLKQAVAAVKADVLINSVAPPEFRLGRAATCTAPFVTQKAYCEKTITSGVSVIVKITNKGKGKSHKTTTLDGFTEAALANVEVEDVVAGSGIEAGTTVTAKPTKTSVTLSKAATKEEEAEFTFTREPRCTAGPMLIKGNETYMLTAGHCFGETETPAGGEAIDVEVVSEYPPMGGQKEIGKEGERYFLERDMAEVKVKRPGSFAEALPNPVPALMTEWKENPKTPHDVTGDEGNVEGKVNCHEGQTSGEECGTVGTVGVEVLGTKHLVEDTACGELGDSGGPFFKREEATDDILMQGVLIIANIAKKCSEGGKTTYYEPLQDIAGAAGFGVLSTFAGQELLTTANEVRPPCAGVCPTILLLSGTALPIDLHSQSDNPNNGILTRLANAAGPVLEGKGFSVLFGFTNLNNMSDSSYLALFLEVTEPKEALKCNTAGDKTGEVLLPTALFLLVGAPSGGVESLQLVPEFTIKCATLSVKVKGSALSSVTPIGSEVEANSNSITSKLHCKNESLGEPELTKYLNEKSEETLIPTLLVNAGAGFVRSCEEIKPTITLLPGAMIDIME
jgi:Trypsin